MVPWKERKETNCLPVIVVSLTVTAQMIAHAHALARRHASAFICSTDGSKESDWREQSGWRVSYVCQVSQFDLQPGLGHLGLGPHRHGDHLGVHHCVVPEAETERKINLSSQNSAQRIIFGVIKAPLRFRPNSCIKHWTPIGFSSLLAFARGFQNELDPLIKVSLLIGLQTPEASFRRVALTPPD